MRDYRRVGLRAAPAPARPSRLAMTISAISVFSRRAAPFFHLSRHEGSHAASIDVIGDAKTGGCGARFRSDGIAAASRRQDASSPGRLLPLHASRMTREPTAYATGGDEVEFMLAP